MVGAWGKGDAILLILDIQSLSSQRRLTMNQVLELIHGDLLLSGFFLSRKITIYEMHVNIRVIVDWVSCFESVNNRVCVHGNFT